MNTPARENGAPPVRADDGAAEFVREQHRRLFGLLRTLSASRDPDERIELAGELCAEIHQLLALERGVLAPALTQREEVAADVASRRARLAELADELAAAVAGGEIAKPLLDELFNCAAEHVNEAIRVMLPSLERLPPQDAQVLEGQLRDLKERLAEH